MTISTARHPSPPVAAKVGYMTVQPPGAGHAAPARMQAPSLDPRGSPCRRQNPPQHHPPRGMATEDPLRAGDPFGRIFDCREHTGLDQRLDLAQAWVPFTPSLPSWTRWSSQGAERGRRRRQQRALVLVLKPVTLSARRAHHHKCPVPAMPARAGTIRRSGRDRDQDRDRAKGQGQV